MSTTATHHVLTGDAPFGGTWEGLSAQGFLGAVYDAINCINDFPGKEGDTYGRPGAGVELINHGIGCHPGPAFSDPLADKAIVLQARAVDGEDEPVGFDTIADARAWVAKRMGNRCEVGSTYLVSFDGIATIHVLQGTTPGELVAAS